MLCVLFVFPLWSPHFVVVGHPYMPYFWFIWPSLLLSVTPTCRISGLFGLLCCSRSPLHAVFLVCLAYFVVVGHPYVSYFRFAWPTLWLSVTPMCHISCLLGLLCGCPYILFLVVFLCPSLLRSGRCSHLSPVRWPSTAM